MDKICRNYKPLLTVEDFKEFTDSYYSLVSKRRNNLISEEEFHEEGDKLEKKFYSKVGPNDEWVFDNPDEIRKAMSGFIPNKDLEDMISHELEHATKAKSLGYNPKYVLLIMKKGKGINVAPFLRFSEDVSKKNYEEIRASVSNPSNYDLI